MPTFSVRSVRMPAGFGGRGQKTGRLPLVTRLRTVTNLCCITSQKNEDLCYSSLSYPFGVQGIMEEQNVGKQLLGTLYILCAVHWDTYMWERPTGRTVFLNGLFQLNYPLHFLTFCWSCISVINQLDAQNFCFTISLFHASTCFEHMRSSSGGQNCITQRLVSSHL